MVQSVSPSNHGHRRCGVSNNAALDRPGGGANSGVYELSIHVATFYAFVGIDDCRGLQQQLAARGCAAGLVGTILVAPEGINATIAGGHDPLAAFLDELRDDARFAGITIKYSTAKVPPFRRLKVRLKREIVTLGAPEARPAEATGKRIRPSDWNDYIADPSIILIDTRNTYEIAIGTFPGAIDPGTSTFGAFKDFVSTNLDPARDLKIAMFCTGGIRCEKASAYLLSRGFADVAQLDGGILAYLEQVPRAESRWRGDCYVFDERVGLAVGLEPGAHVMCRSCGLAIPAGATCRCE